MRVRGLILDDLRSGSEIRIEIDSEDDVNIETHDGQIKIDRDDLEELIEKLKEWCDE